MSEEQWEAEALGSWHKLTRLRCQRRHALVEGDYKQCFKTCSKDNLRMLGFGPEVTDFGAGQRAKAKGPATTARLQTAVREILEAGHALTHPLSVLCTAATAPPPTGFCPLNWQGAMGDFGGEDRPLSALQERRAAARPFTGNAQTFHHLQLLLCWEARVPQEVHLVYEAILALTQGPPQVKLRRPFSRLAPVANRSWNSAVRSMHKNARGRAVQRSPTWLPANTMNKIRWGSAQYRQRVGRHMARLEYLPHGGLQPPGCCRAP